MRYKLFGNSGLRVSELCLGAMTFGEEWGWGASKEESRRLFDAFAEAGGNFIDTANHYTGGTSERYVGEFIAAERERFVLATKYTLNGRPDDPNGGGNHRKSMVQALDASLKRFNTDYIDLYWLHAWDFMTPVEEVIRAFDNLVRAGKVPYIGISDAPAWIVSRANTLAELRGWSPFVGLQIQYSLIERTPSQVAINWVRQQKRSVIIPILGARILPQLRDNLVCLDFTLTDEQLQRLDAVSAIEPGFPHDFLAREGVQKVIYGNSLPLIDNHRTRN